MFSKLKFLKLRWATAKTEKAELELEALRLALAPHNNLPVNIYRDGSNWVCILETHEDFTKCVVAYGSSPKQAALNFDAIWEGSDFIFDDEEEPEEEF